MFNSVRPHRWQPTRLHHPRDSSGKNTGVGCHFLLPCMKVKSEKWKWSCSVSVRFFMTPWTTAHQAPPSMGFSRQEYWSGVPLLSPQCPEIFNVIHNKIHNKMEIKQTNSYGSLRPVRNQNISFVFSSCCKVGNQWLSSFFSFLKKLRNQRKYGEWSHSSRV